MMAEMKCRDTNLQMAYQMILGYLGETEAKEVIVQCAEQLGLAFNHQTKPRCFNHNTAVFPWKQFGAFQ
jgi:hypothetical protein